MSALENFRDVLLPGKVRDQVFKDRDGQMVKSLAKTTTVKLLSDEFIHDFQPCKNRRLKQVMDLIKRGKDPGNEEFMKNSFGGVGAKGDKPYKKDGQTRQRSAPA